MAVAAQPDRPLAGVDYPSSFGEFVDWFQSDEDCWRYLVRLRWPDGFRCSRCGKRGLLFYRALQFAVRAPPTGYQTLVWSRRGRADQERLRGPARGTRPIRRRTA